MRRVNTGELLVGEKSIGVISLDEKLSSVFPVRTRSIGDSVSAGSLFLCPETPKHVKFCWLLPRI